MKPIPVAAARAGVVPKTIGPTPFGPIRDASPSVAAAAIGVQRSAAAPSAAATAMQMRFVTRVRFASRASETLSPVDPRVLVQEDVS